MVKIKINPIIFKMKAEQIFLNNKGIMITINADAAANIVNNKIVSNLVIMDRFLKIYWMMGVKGRSNKKKSPAKKLLVLDILDEEARSFFWGLTK